MGCWRIWSCWDLMFKPQKIMETGMETGWDGKWLILIWIFGLCKKITTWDLWRSQKNSSVLFVISSWKKDPSRLIMRPLLFPRWNPRTRDLISGNVKCCWWLKSCTSSYVVYPIIYRVLYIPGGAGCLPSTVCQIPNWSRITIFEHEATSRIFKCISRTMRIAQVACFFGPFQWLPPIVVTFQTQDLFVKNVQGGKKLGPPVPEETLIFRCGKKNHPTSNSPKKNTFQTGGEQKP